VPKSALLIANTIERDGAMAWKFRSRLEECTAEFEVYIESRADSQFVTASRAPGQVYDVTCSGCRVFARFLWVDLGDRRVRVLHTKKLILCYNS
jgi:hypothetical protein